MAEVVLNQGEIRIKLLSPITGKVTLKELGLDMNELKLEGGLLRLVFDLEGIGEHQYFHKPTIQIASKEKVGATHWQCEFNEEVILDKIDHSGQKTVMLLDREILKNLEHHHQNELIVHGEFPEEVNLCVEHSYINFFN